MISPSISCWLVTAETVDAADVLESRAYTFAFDLDWRWEELLPAFWRRCDIFHHHTMAVRRTRTVAVIVVVVEDGITSNADAASG
jgi:hypothetical protein